MTRSSPYPLALFLFVTTPVSSFVVCVMAGPTTVLVGCPTLFVPVVVVPFGAVAGAVDVDGLFAASVAATEAALGPEVALVVVVPPVPVVAAEPGAEVVAVTVPGPTVVKSLPELVAATGDMFTSKL